ncbi:hypothetical protein BD410DRAFT_855882 [Rickenella mellea]|uniref:Uncharacterized protein n=1 Tax=Rickenella mellea TaxID=50990 RepID=A0A4Y7PJ57_9AGAM|nr:hypothetical protein BD410DRAFT_855882 [Rickenella mellea]
MAAASAKRSSHRDQEVLMNGRDQTSELDGRVGVNDSENSQQRAREREERAQFSDSPVNSPHLSHTNSQIPPRLRNADSESKKRHRSPSRTLESEHKDAEIENANREIERLSSRVYDLKRRSIVKDELLQMTEMARQEELARHVEDRSRKELDARERRGVGEVTQGILCLYELVALASWLCAVYDAQHGPTSLPLALQELFIDYAQNISVCAITPIYEKSCPALYELWMNYARLRAGTARIVGPKNVEVVAAYILPSISPVPMRRWEEDRTCSYLISAIRKHQTAHRAAYARTSNARIYGSTASTSFHQTLAQQGRGTIPPHNVGNLDIVPMLR